jgi:hypothetical protein
MGAVAALLLLAEHKPSSKLKISAVVADSPFSTIQAAIQNFIS